MVIFRYRGEVQCDHRPLEMDNAMCEVTDSQLQYLFVIRYRQECCHNTSKHVRTTTEIYLVKTRKHQKALYSMEQAQMEMSKSG